MITTEAEKEFVSKLRKLIENTGVSLVLHGERLYFENRKSGEEEIYFDVTEIFFT